MSHQEENIPFPTTSGVFITRVTIFLWLSSSDTHGSLWHGGVEPAGKSPGERPSASWEEEETILQERDLRAGTAKASELQGFGGHYCSHESHWILVPSTLVLGLPTGAWLFSVEKLHPSWCSLPHQCHMLIVPRGREDPGPS